MKTGVLQGQEFRRAAVLAGLVHSLLVFVFVFLVYWLTIPRELSLADDGFFVLNSFSLGISHPPGYPAYSFLGKLFTLIPVGTVAFRVHLLSAVLGALTCVMLWHCMQMIVEEKKYAYLASLSFGFSPVFWSQAIIAEVYTLNTAIFFALFLLVLNLRRVVTAEGFVGINAYLVKLALLGGLLFGLGLSNHWPLMLAYSITFVVLLLPCWRLVAPLCKPFLLALVVGLMPYVWMYFRSRQPLLLDVLGLFPFDGFSDFVAYLKRDDYKSLDTSQTANFTDKIRFILSHMTQLFSQYTYFSIPLIMLGVSELVRKDKHLAIALLFGALLPEVALLVKVDFDFDSLKESALSVYPLVTYGLIAVFLAQGMKAIVIWCAGSLHGKAVRLLPAVLVIFYISTVFFLGFIKNDRHDYEWAKGYGEGVFSLLPANAVLIINGDVDVGVLGYYHIIEGVRSDVTILTPYDSFQNHVFGRRLRSDELQLQLMKLLESKERPVFMLRGAGTDFLPENLRNQQFGLISHLSLSEGAMVITDEYNPSLFVFMKRQLDYPSDDIWTNDGQNDLATRAGYLVSCYGWPDDGIVGKLTASPFGLLGLAQGEMFCGKISPNTLGYLKRAAELAGSSVPKSVRAKIYLHIAQLELSGNVNSVEGLHFMELSVNSQP